MNLIAPSANGYAYERRLAMTFKTQQVGSELGSARGKNYHKNSESRPRQSGHPVPDSQDTPVLDSQDTSTKVQQNPVPDSQDISRNEPSISPSVASEPLRPEP
jgi:hypothetical protein